MKKVILILFILIISFIGIKLYYIDSYKLTKNEVKEFNSITKGLIIKDLKVINKTKLDEYITYKNIRIKDLFKDYECKEEDSIYKCISNDKVFSINIDKSYKNKYNSKLYKGEDDIAFFGRIKEIKPNKESIFRTFSNIKNDYKLVKYTIKNIPKILSIDLVEGDYTGYIMHTSSSERILRIETNNKTYVFTFTNNIDILDEVMNGIEIK